MRVRSDQGAVDHLAGQYATLGLGAWEPTLPDVPDHVADEPRRDLVIKRAYSISSSILDDEGALIPPDADELEFYVTLVRDDDPVAPSLTCRMFALEVGDRLFLGPRAKGRYTLDGVRPDEPVLFLATGTGEAPHNRMTLELLRAGHEGPITSVVTVRRRADLGYAAVHERLEERYPGYRYLPLPTREPGVEKRYVQDVLRSADAADVLGLELDPDRTHVYVCGNPKMVGAPSHDVPPSDDGVVGLCVERGYPLPSATSRLHYETYWS